jgi:PKD repeat protein
MKRIFTLLILLGLAQISLAQNNFFTPTNYRGAIDPDTTKDWTKTWTNWEPQTTTYPATTISINAGDITTNTTWTKSNVYLLNDGYVYVTNGATLTIEAGTVIRGTGKGTIIICRGSKIYAKGTINEPIVFTSNNAANLRGPGNWGGLVITGRAKHNLPQGDTAAAEGGIAKPVSGSGEIDGRYGGNNDEDSSGVLEYVRVEFAGIPLTTASNSEINGITLYSVGRKTKIDNVMVSYSGDDSYEWFGGTVNAKHLIAYAGIDDDFDTDNGFRGMIQFGIGFRHPSNSDQSGSNGFESDNDANGSKNLPQTAAVFSNMTIVGPYFSGQSLTVTTNFRRAAHIRRNSALSLLNSILAGYPDAGILIDSRLTNASFQNGTALFKHNVIAGIPSGWAGKLASSSDTLTNTSTNAVRAFVVSNNNDTFNISNEINLNRPFSYSNPSFSPLNNSAAISNSNFNTGKTPYDAKPSANFTHTNNLLTFTFTSTVDTKGFESTYEWDFGTNGSKSNQMNPVFSFPNNGTYTVNLTVKNNWDSIIVSKSVGVNVNLKPTVGFNFAQTNPNTRDYIFSNTTNTKGFATTYRWEFGTGGATSTDANPSFTFPANGFYTVKLTATNMYDSSSISKSVGVSIVNTPEKFFDYTTYRGAINPDTTKDWTKGWANWTPQTTVYPATTVNINAGDISTNTTWTKNNVYLLNDGYVYVNNGATLTIEAGTVIRGTGKGTIIVSRGSKIYAKGTANEPIIFTSNNAANLRGPGNWGGLVLTGRAVHNLPQGDTAAAEGGIAKPVTGSGDIDGRFGGNNDDDSSGVLEYVRVEFAGIPLTTASNSEINGITLYSVGRKTKIDHVMVSYSGDDSYEWFGGTVNAKHLIAYAGIDDDFDTDNGFRGNIQYAIGFRHPSNADQSGSNGFESDNDANGTRNTPITSAVFSNVTFVGPYFDGQSLTVNSNFRRAAHIRRNSSITVVNSIMTGYPDAGLLVDSRLTASNFDKGYAIFKNNIIGGIPSGWAGKLASSSDTLSLTNTNAVRAWVVTNNTDTFNKSNEVNLVRPFSYENPNFAPGSSSVANSNSNFTTGKTPFNANPLVDFTFAPTVANSRNYKFNNTSNTRGIASTYRWEFGSNGAMSTDENPVFNFPANGSFIVKLTVSNSFDSSFASKTVEVFATEKPAANFTFKQDTTNGSRKFNFTNTTDTKGYATTYKWDFGVAGATSTDENPTYTYAANGVYTVKLIASNSFLSDTITKTINVIATAISEVKENITGLNIYPNPTQTEVNFNFNLNSSENVSIEIIDMNGRTVQMMPKTSMNAGNYTINGDASMLQQGIYFAKISTENSSLTQKLVIVK